MRRSDMERDCTGAFGKGKSERFYRSHDQTSRPVVCLRNVSRIHMFIFRLIWKTIIESRTLRRKRMNKEWSEVNRLMQSQIKKRDTYRSTHCVLHRYVIYFECIHAMRGVGYGYSKNDKRTTRKHRNVT